jgi:hypothetical protein
LLNCGEHSTRVNAIGVQAPGTENLRYLKNAPLIRKSKAFLPCVAVRSVANACVMF